MSRSSYIAMFLFLSSFLATTFILKGCSTLENFNELSPSQRLEIYVDSYILTVDTVIELAEQGQLTLEQVEDFNEVREQLSSELDNLREVIENPDTKLNTTKVQLGFKSVETLLLQLKEYSK